MAPEDGHGALAARGLPLLLNPRDIGPPLPLAGRSILFVGGKGGVGKSTTAAALAVHWAEQGERVLLVSTDPAHSLADLFDAPVGDQAREILPRLDAIEIDPEGEVVRYLARVAGTMRRFVRPEMYPEIERQMALTRHSPGAEEAALLDRVTRIMEEGRDGHDRIIFDTAPTGHTLRLLSLPEIMAAWTDGLIRSRDRSDSFGRALDRLGRIDHSAQREGVARPEPRGDDLTWLDDPADDVGDERTRQIRDTLVERRRRFTHARRLLLDASVTAFVLVLIPEKLPILESEKALEVLRGHRVPVAGVVVNRVLPDAPLGDFLEARRGQEAEYLAWVDRSFGDLPRVRVPLLARDVHGLESLHAVGRHLLGGR